jgi:UDP-N-acetylglucosamine 2-epimerase (non-hydrolysing)
MAGSASEQRKKLVSKTLRLLIVAGARPNFMKVAPIIHEIRARQDAHAQPSLEYRLVHTGQHYDEQMSAVFFAELGIPAPDDNLEVGSGSHAVQTARIMEAFEPVCQRERPDWVLVVGDVNSTMACTLVCAKLGIRVAHVEAGLRSFDRTMPEEVNRIVTDALADLLLTPSLDGDENLLREGISREKIKCVGNVMIDSLVANLPKSSRSQVLNRLGLQEKRFVFVTLHRPANVDEAGSLRKIMDALGQLSAKVPVVFAMHPRTAQRCKQFGISVDSYPQLRIVEPLGYHDSLRLTQAAALVLTDSGGLQEESTYFLTPCLTLRPNTERPVTITVGSNRLTNFERLAVDVEDALGTSAVSRGQIPPLWDGHCAERILDCIIQAS